ncbi:MAG: HAMP domain-containing protein [Proteobacteria bacterium]|nr:HAMP domain-containing protein [Pseudomonadota bacterium]
MSTSAHSLVSRYRARFNGVSIQYRVFMVLLLLSVLLGTSIIIPGYLKIRHFEWLEAKEYGLDTALHMRDKIERRITVLEKAGVAEIESYIEQSKQDLLAEFKAAEPGQRVTIHIITAAGRVLFDGGDASPLPLAQGLLQQIDSTETNHLLYESLEQNWLTSFVKHEPWDWYLLSMMSEREVYHQSSMYLQYVIAISAVMLLFITCLFVVLARGLRNGITTTIEQLESIGKGRYDQRLEVTGPGELGVLQKSMNAMINQTEIEIMTRKSVEQDLNTARLQAEEDSHIKEGKVIELRKQFKSSITGVCGFSELLLKTNLEDHQRVYVETILKAHKQLISLIDDRPPLSGIAAEQTTMSRTRGLVSAGDQTLLRGIKVLLLEMAPLNHEYISEVLEDNQLWIVNSRRNNGSGNKPDNHQVDLVLLDDHFAGRSIDEQTEFVLNNLSPYLGEVPILVIVSENGPLHYELYLKAGASAFITKPFSSTELLNKISGLFTADRIVADL